MKNLKYILFTIGGILIYSSLKASKIMTNRFTKFTNLESIKLLMLQKALIKAGLKDPVLKFALAQLLFETGRFTAKSKVASENNNYSGIKYLNRTYQKATRGSLAPPNERVSDINSPLNYYAKFASVDDWAKDFVRIISLQRSGNLAGKPVDSISLKTYIDRLALNKYFGSDRNLYLAGTKKYFDMFEY